MAQIDLGFDLDLEFVAEPPYFLQKIVDILNCLSISGISFASNIVALFDVLDIGLGHMPIVHAYGAAR
jgi:hypothetical protein